MMNSPKYKDYLSNKNAINNLSGNNQKISLNTTSSKINYNNERLQNNSNNIQAYQQQPQYKPKYLSRPPSAQREKRLSQFQIFSPSRQTNVLLTQRSNQIIKQQDNKYNFSKPINNKKNQSLTTEKGNNIINQMKQWVELIENEKKQLDKQISLQKIQKQEIINKLQKQIQNYKSKNQQINKLFDAQKSKTNSLEKQLKKQKQLHQQTRKQLQIKKCTNVQTTAQLQKANSRKIQLQVQLQKQKTKKQNYQLKCDEYEEEIIKLQQYNQKLQNRFKALQTTFNSFNQDPLLISRSEQMRKSRCFKKDAQNNIENCEEKSKDSLQNLFIIRNQSMVDLKKSMTIPVSLNNKQQNKRVRIISVEKQHKNHYRHKTQN